MPSTWDPPSFFFFLLATSLYISHNVCQRHTYTCAPMCLCAQRGKDRRLLALFRFMVHSALCCHRAAIFFSLPPRISCVLRTSIFVASFLMLDRGGERMRKRGGGERTQERRFLFTKEMRGTSERGRPRQTLPLLLPRPSTSALLPVSLSYALSAFHFPNRLSALNASLTPSPL